MLALADLGPRIMICGPSNAGKSSLAAAIGQKLGLEIVHLDRFRFLPNSDWQQRSDADFQTLHDAAIVGERWVIDGNYTKLVPQPLARATGIALVSDNRWANYRRYLWRTLFQKHRVGNLEGAQDSLKWDMAHWILVRSPQALIGYRQRLPAAGLPFIEARSMREVRGLYREWGLLPPR